MYHWCKLNTYIKQLHMFSKPPHKHGSRLSREYGKILVCVLLTLTQNSLLPTILFPFSIHNVAPSLHIQASSLLRVRVPVSASALVTVPSRGLFSIPKISPLSVLLRPAAPLDWYSHCLSWHRKDTVLDSTFPFSFTLYIYIRLQNLIYP